MSRSESRAYSCLYVMPSRRPAEETIHPACFIASRISTGPAAECVIPCGSALTIDRLGSNLGRPDIIFLSIADIALPSQIKRRGGGPQVGPAPDVCRHQSYNATEYVATLHPLVAADGSMPSSTDLQVRRREDWVHWLRRTDRPKFAADRPQVDHLHRLIRPDGDRLTERDITTERMTAAVARAGALQGFDERVRELSADPAMLPGGTLSDRSTTRRRLSR